MIPDANVRTAKTKKEIESQPEEPVCDGPSSKRTHVAAVHKVKNAEGAEDAKDGPGGASGWSKA